MNELYKKYRPKTFREMVGNFGPLEDLVKSDKCPHAFLFTGASGAGKTSSCRIIKNMLGVDDMDYREFNASSTRGIDTIRSIIDSLGQTSFGGGPVMFVLDECHQISGAAAEALLKPLEDTPKHVYFILCTTEPSKIITAIKTRCTIVDFPAIPDDLLFDLVDDTAAAEDVSLSTKLIKQIVAVSAGSARKALVVLDQILSTTEENYAKILSDNNAVDESAEVIEVCRQVYDNGSNSSMNEILSKLKDQKEDPEKIRRAILGYGASMLLKAKEDRKKSILLNMEPFLRNTYDTGFPGLVYACNKTITREVF